MKTKFLFQFFFFLSLVSYSQNVKIFMIEFSDRKFLPAFELVNNYYEYDGNDLEKNIFFSKHKILDFFQSFPDSRVDKNLNIFTFVTYTEDFAQQLINRFPKEYLSFVDVSDFRVELDNTYPNDYGGTSPIVNLGTSQEISSFDYINVPKAWDFGYGDSNVLIGISDSKILETDLEFQNKTIFLPSYTYHSVPFSATNAISRHGTSVAAIAAAQGNNGYGMSGICGNCGIVATSYGYGSPGSYNNPNPNLNNLLQLALNGARVINMSWSGLFSYQNTYYQWIFDELHDMGVVLVASSGNSDATTSTNSLYPFPASYNHVISVTSVNHLNELYDVFDGTKSYYVKDMIAPQVYPNFNNSGMIVSNVSDPTKLHNTNNKVDIAAPGFQYFLYANHLLGGIVNWTGNPVFHGDGTSGAAPHVTGTIGLMISQNPCLLPDEIEDILQLSAKNLENIQGNEHFIGRIGAGKLETGDAVEFVNEMMSSGGNAVIDGNDFWRFDFSLQKINNNLLISNQTFRDENTSSFTAKNAIKLLPGTKLKPNHLGFIKLNIDSDIIVDCQPIQRKTTNSGYLGNETIQKKIIESVYIYPNPNNGLFRINFPDLISEDLNIVVLDINGRIVANKNIMKVEKNNNYLEVDIESCEKGIYFVKVYSDFSQKLFKVIKK